MHGKSLESKIQRQLRLSYRSRCRVARFMILRCKSKTKNDATKNFDLVEQLTVDSNRTDIQIGPGAAKEIGVGIGQGSVGPGLESYAESGFGHDLHTNANRAGKKCIVARIRIEAGATDGRGEVGAPFIARSLVGAANLQYLDIDTDARLSSRQIQFGGPVLLRIKDFPLRIRSITQIQNHSEARRILELVSIVAPLNVERSAKPKSADRSDFEIERVFSSK